MKKNLALIFILLLILSSCSKVENFDSPIYTGQNLKIGIVGKKPNIREENISFKQLSMEDLLNENFDNLDSVFITKSYLSEAAKEQYADVYLNSPIPFIFIDSDKVYLAFTDKDVSYEDAHSIKSGDYLVGYYKDSYFGLGLYNDIKNEITIQDSFSRLFIILDKFKNTGKISIK